MDYYDTLCMSGGGIKGFSFVSALKYLYDNHNLDMTKIKTFVGTSMGGILCFFLSLNYTLDELYDFIIKFNFKILEPSINIDNFLLNYGVEQGKKAEIIFINFLKEKYNKTDITFKELYNLTKNKLILIGTNYTKAKEEAFDYINTPELSVITALRITMSIPLVFTPILYNNCYYVDGGIINNFPIKYCNKNTTLGLYIKLCSDNNNLDSVFNIFQKCIVMVGDSINEKDINNNDVNIIVIKNIQETVDVIDFNLDIKKKEELFNLGVQASKEFIENYSYKICKNIINDIINKL